MAYKKYGFFASVYILIVLSLSHFFLNSQLPVTIAIKYLFTTCDSVANIVSA